MARRVPERGGGRVATRAPRGLGGSPRALECDEGSLTHALYAGAGGIPFVPCPPGPDLTDIPRVDPELYARVRDPWSGEEFWAVRALRPDVALLAAHVADEAGTMAIDRSPFTDRWMALAARRRSPSPRSSSSRARRCPGRLLRRGLQVDAHGNRNLICVGTGPAPSSAARGRWGSPSYRRCVGR